MPSYRIAHKPDIMTTYLRGVFRHPPEFLRINAIRFEPVITVTAAGGVTLEDPAPVTVDAGQAFIIQKIRGYAAHGVWDAANTEYRPVKPAELAQFRFNIRDQTRRKTIFDTSLSIASLLDTTEGASDVLEWNRGEFLTVPASTLECIWTGPAALTNFAGTGAAGADIRLGVVLVGLSVSADVLNQFNMET